MSRRDQDTTFDTKTKAVTLKTKTVKILSQDCLETRQCLETSHHCPQLTTSFVYNVFHISFHLCVQIVSYRIVSYPIVSYCIVSDNVKTGWNWKWDVRLSDAVVWLRSISSLRLWRATLFYQWSRPLPSYLWKLHVSEPIDSNVRPI